MANYASLKAAIQEVIKTNGNNEITGQLLQNSLIAMINSLGAGYQFAGIAVPGTSPGTPDQNVFYIAGPGTYPNFNETVVPQNYIGVFSYNGSWTNTLFQTSPFSATAISGGIVQLMDGDNPIYPRTKAAAVFLGNDTDKTLEKETREMGGAIQCNHLDDLLRSYESVEITSDLLSTLICNNAGVVIESTSANRSLILRIDPTATYKWGTSRNVYGFNDYPKVGDTPTLIGLIRTITNLSTYKYVLINLVQAGEIFTYSKNIVDVNNLAAINRIINAEFTKTDVLTGATILPGYYNGNTGAYVANSDYSAIEISVDNSVDLNKVFVETKIGKRGTTLVPWVIFFNGNTVISTYYGDVNDKLIRQIPFGTTRIAFNLLTNYTSQRGDEIFMVSTNTLQHVAGTIAEIKSKDVTQDAQIAQLQASIGQLDYYSQYIDVDKTTTANRIAVWIDEAQNIQSEQYQIKVDFTHPGGLTEYQLYKGTTAHGGLERIEQHLQVGKTYTVTKDSAKPVLYLYGSATETQVAEYTVNVLLTVINKDGIKYQNSILYGNSLANKKFVVFGDSLSEFTDPDGKTWSQHVQEITNADIVNVAIGGTQLRQRTPKVARAFKETVSYSVDDRVFYKPAGATKMNCYNCINAHVGAWNDNDFEELASYGTIPYATLDIINMIAACCDTSTPIANRFDDQIAAAQCIKDHFSDNNVAIIDRLPGIDWTQIESVIILAGTNDYGQTTSHGQSGSTDINTTMGAINEMVRLLCSTYKHIALYFVSPTVHWKDYAHGVGAPGDWCDVYIPSSGEQITRGQFYDNIIAEFALNHIPSLNLYKELGWNKYNFSDYFWADGTHPTKGKGMFMMAEKIAAYIQANKSF